MFDWLGDIFSGIGNAIGSTFEALGEQISNVIWNTMLQWLYETIYNAVADFFTMMGNMGADIFQLDWIQATIRLFTLFGWALFAAGGRSIDLAGESTSVLVGSFSVANNVSFNLFNILALIAFAYCVIKIFFANIKRGGILLIQIAVGSLYMFSVPRGYQDGFNQWMKQIAALCLTAFMQTSLLFLGLLTFPGNMLLGLGVMLAANEVPRIAQQFGLDSSVRVNMMSVVHATTTAVNLTRSVARATGK